MVHFMTPNERRYWSHALVNPPIDTSFDLMKVSDIVMMLKVMNDDANSGSVWFQMAQIISQLQKAREFMKRTLLADEKGKEKFREEKKKMIQQKHKPNHIDVSAPVIPQFPTLGSPLVHPPSPVRVPARHPFCANNVETCLDTMRRHKMQVKIQEQACRAFVELIRDGKKRRKDKVLEKRWKCSACKFNNEQQDGKCRICVLPKPESAQMITLNTPEETGPLEWERIETGGGISLILDAMRRFGHDRKLLKAGSFALAQLVQENPTAVIKIAAEGGISEILNGMQVNVEDQEVVTQSLGILASPTLTEDSVVRIDGERFAHITCDVLRASVSGPRVSSRLQALGCLALANVALKSDTYGKLLVLELDAHSLVLDILKPTENHQNPHIAASALWTLATFARELHDGTETTIRGKLIEAQVVQVAMGCLHIFPTNQSVLKNANLLLSRLGCTVDASKIDSLSEEDQANCLIQ